MSAHNGQLTLSLQPLDFQHWNNIFWSIVPSILFRHSSKLFQYCIRVVLCNSIHSVVNQACEK